MKAILFDADGVLFDATELHKDAFIQALHRFGYPMTHEEHDTNYNGLPTRIKLERMGVKNPQEIEALKQQITLKLLPEYIIPDPELIEVLEKIHSHYRIAICSNARQATVEHMASLAKITQFFDIVLGNEKVANPKPAPDIFLLGADFLNVNIKECIIFEDSIPGLKAAFASDPGIVIAVKNPKQTVQMLKRFI